MTTSHAPAGHDRPQPGDLVLAWDGRLWNISVHPGPAQLQMAGAPAAVAHACILAARSGVAAWSTRDGVTFTCQHARPPVGPAARATARHG